MTSTDDNIQGKGDRSRSRSREARGKANSKGKANSIEGKANSIQGKGQQSPGQGQQQGKANIIKGKANSEQGKAKIILGSVGGLNVVIDPVGEFAVAASQPSSILPFVQLGQLTAQSSSDICINLAQLAARALESHEDSQCPSDEEIDDSTVSHIWV